MIANAAQIAAVPRARLGAVVRARRFRGLVIGRIAICESVRHDQVQNVVGIESMETLRGGLAIGHRQFEGSFAGGSREVANDRAGAQASVRISATQKDSRRLGLLAVRTTDHVGKIAGHLVACRPCPESKTIKSGVNPTHQFGGSTLLTTGAFGFQRCLAEQPTAEWRKANSANVTGRR